MRYSHPARRGGFSGLVLGCVVYTLGVAGAASTIVVPGRPPAPDRALDPRPTPLARRVAGRAAAGAPAIFESGRLTLSPQDTFLNINDTNFSTNPILATYTWPDYQPANAILMRFDLSVLPAGALVDTATLRLALVQSDPAAGPYTVTAHKLLAKNPDIAKATGLTADGVTAWTPTACCYNGVPLAQADLSPAYDTRALDAAPGFTTWDLTTMVQEWLLDPATNVGVVLNSDASQPRDRYRFFASMEHADASLRPYLEVIVSAPDVTPPSVAITAPVAGTAVSNAVRVTADAADNVGVGGVQFQLNGTPLGPELTAYPYGVTWDSTTVSDGVYALTAVARDLAGNTATSAPVSVSVTNGLLFLAPQDTYLNINATNNSKEPILATYTWPDFRVANAILLTFDVSAVPPRAVVQEATLRLALVQSDTTATATYTVKAHKLVGRNPDVATATGYTADGVVGWTPNACCYNSIPLAQADMSPAYDTQVLDKVPGFKAWTITPMVQEWLLDPATNVGLLLNSDAATPRDRYRFFASREHADPSLRPVLRITYVPAPADVTPPTVTLTAPAPETYLGDVVQAAAGATDDVGVAAVQFQLDGAPLGAELTAEPYVLNWDTSTVPDGEYTLTASARDTAGNLAGSNGVRVRKDKTQPTVSITAPAAGATVTGTISVSANASDNVGVVGVQFTLDGANLGFEVTTAPYAVSWNAAAATSGLHTLTAVARDAAGNVATSAAVTVTVANPPTITSFTPPSGPVGTSVTISGTNLTGATAVTFNGTSTRFTVSSATALQATVPTGATTGRISVTTAGGTATSFSTFTVVPPPTIASFTPASGPVGTSVTIGGTNLTGATAVTFNGTTTSFTVSSATAIQATVPAGATTGPVSVTTAGGTATSGANFTVSTSGSGGGIAALYPGDVGIESHPDVVLVERFDESTLTNLFSRWTDVLNGSVMSFSTDAPAGSPVGKSLNIPWVGGGLNNGGHLYKQLSPGIDDVLFVRYYIKYPTTGRYDHTGIWVGGSNPPLSYPNPQAGTKPTGNDRLIAAAEQNTEQASFTPRFDHYNYWMTMRQSNDGKYWGNLLLNDPNVRATTGQWMCVEHMVKLNNPTTSFNGEHAIWLNGVKVSHLGQGFPNGRWSGGIFTQDPAGSPFEGFRWRSDANLTLNWIWLQVYAPSDPAGFTSSIKFDHVVVAKSYVGCLTPSAPPDAIPPGVSISAPTAGGTVSGSAVPVSATASDNVGVAGVQFKLNGINLGAEDTTAPYSVSWDSTKVANGSHTLTAEARDAAGNRTTSPGITVNVSNSSSSGRVIFDTNWSTATGTSRTAVTDGGRWPNYWEFNNGTSVQLLSVVSGGPSGHNALRVQQRGPTYAANLQINDFVPQSTDYYVRYYMKNDDTSSAGDHVATVDTWEYWNLTFMRKYSGASNWRFVMSLYGCGYTYPIGHWGPSIRLANGEWYRFEYHVRFVSANRVQVHPRVYDAAGALLFSDADFRQEDYGSSSWNGRNDWTLASYYAAGHTFCVDPVWMNEFGLGNNGQQGSSDTGRYWYFAAVQIRTDTWPGPVPAAGVATASAAGTAPLYRDDDGLENGPEPIAAGRLEDALRVEIVARPTATMPPCLSVDHCEPAVLRRARSVARGRRRRGTRFVRTRSTRGGPTDDILLP